MRKLDLHGTCSKCGFGTREGEWRSSITVVYLPDVPASMLGPRAECLLRRCPRCGYEWNEACLDAESEDTSEGS